MRLMRHGREVKTQDTAIPSSSPLTAAMLGQRACRPTRAPLTIDERPVPCTVRLRTMPTQGRDHSIIHHKLGSGLGFAMWLT